jgi:hypothetical protein
MSRFCKAYPISAFRRYAKWSDPAGKTFAEDAYLFIHDNFAVTEGVFNDEGIVFDSGSDEWKEFCQKDLEFHLPDYLVDDKATAPAA